MKIQAIKNIRVRGVHIEKDTLAEVDPASGAYLIENALALPAPTTPAKKKTQKKKTTKAKAS